MVQRTTISIPDELYSKMEKWKSRFNFSRIFQERIGSLIDQHEAYEKNLRGDSDMDEIVERLKKEKLESMDEYFEQGKTDGLSWAKNSHYISIMEVVNLNDVGDLRQIDQDSVVIEYLEDAIKEDDVMGYADDGRTWLNEPTTKYMEGFIKGVKDFYHETGL